MSASLVGSEMCIRDRAYTARAQERPRNWSPKPSRGAFCGVVRAGAESPCLLYTSDAADDM
eukprot:7850386-Alexandrium_andersonii.AAC.1